MLKIIHILLNLLLILLYNFIKSILIINIKYM